MINCPTHEASYKTIFTRTIVGNYQKLCPLVSNKLSMCVAGGYLSLSTQRGSADLAFLFTLKTVQHKPAQNIDIAAPGDFVT